MTEEKQNTEKTESAEKGSTEGTEKTEKTEKKEAKKETKEKEKKEKRERKEKPEKEIKKEPLPVFNVGDTIRVYTKIVEGEKVRLQPFEGFVMAFKGKGISRTFTVRKIARGGIGVERIWPLHCPSIIKIKVLKKGKVRRAKLYYMRKRKGKAAMKIKEKTKNEKPKMKNTNQK